VTALIEGQLPDTWQELEVVVGRILRECGYDVEVQKSVKLARGNANIDVWADDDSSPPNVIAVECKRWRTAVPQNVVHAFRAVVGDSGANNGLLISAAGFQKGAVEAAQYSNVRLLTWDEFQTMFGSRWYRTFMAPRVFAEADPLIEYTEPINSRISRRERELGDGALARLHELRERYASLGIGLLPLLMDTPGNAGKPKFPPLPLREQIAGDAAAAFPDEVLDAAALRPLMDALSRAYAAATAEFDEVFGGRA
jgi:restriction system protein